MRLIPSEIPPQKNRGKYKNFVLEFIESEEETVLVDFLPEVKPESIWQGFYRISKEIPEFKVIRRGNDIYLTKVR